MATEKINSEKCEASVLKLQSIVHTRGGASFDPALDVWSYRENSVKVSLNFTRLGLVDRFFVGYAKAVIASFAENSSASHTVNMFEALHRFCMFRQETVGSPLAEITLADILNYRASLGEREWHLRTLAVLLKKWYELGYPGIEPACISAVRAMRLKSNPKGAAVLTMDPHNGPYSDLEVEAIQSSLNECYAEGAISTRHYVLIWMFLLLGQRPVQYANLRLADLSVVTTSEGSRSYLLQVPRAKQRTGSSRSYFTPRALLAQFGVIAHEYVNDVKKKFSGRTLDANHAPFFPGEYNSTAPKGFEYHLTSRQLGLELIEALSWLDIRSERTGSQMHFTATRFRRTLGTRAAAEGHGELVIAELLDHSDTSNAGVYVQATPAIVERIDRAIAMQLAPLAQAFAGVLIRNESEAERGDDPSSRIIDPRLGKAMKPMGSCGKHGFCGFAAPIACYTCANFQPWLDGPHEAVLASLIDERERLKRDTDARIAAVNDRTILAVAEVVRRCEAAQAGDSNG